MDASARLRRIAAELKTAGETGIRRELNKAIRASAQPLKTSVQNAALAQLPRSGGLAKREADNVKIQILTSARNSGIRMRNTRIGASQTEKGYVRHPVFGTWRPGVPSQQIPRAEGWWSYTLAKEAPVVARALTATITAYSFKIGRL